MPKIEPGEEGLYIALPSLLAAELRELAQANGRAIRYEVEHALRRHLAAPPRLVVRELPTSVVEPPEVMRRKRGRPRKQQ